MMYILLGLGIVLAVVALVLRNRAPKVALVLQIVLIVVLVGALVYHIVNMPRYNEFIDTITGRYQGAL